MRNLQQGHMDTSDIDHILNLIGFWRLQTELHLTSS